MGDHGLPILLQNFKPRRITLREGKVVRGGELLGRVEEVD